MISYLDPKAKSCIFQRDLEDLKSINLMNLREIVLKQLCKITLEDAQIIMGKGKIMTNFCLIFEIYSSWH